MLTKGICEILSSYLIVGIVVGGSLADVRKYLPPDGETPSEFLLQHMLQDVPVRNRGPHVPL